MKKLALITSALLLLTMTACDTQSHSTRANNYPEMYNERPATIVIMPPINKTMDVEAKEYFYYSLSAPLCEAGYYVVSPYLAYQMFKTESAYDSEMFINNDNLEIFGKVFNADAILFTIINKWEKSKIGGYININAEYILKSPKSNKVIFQRSGDLTIDTSIDPGGGALGALAGMIATAITTTDYTQMNAARTCNHYIFGDIPRGKYSIDCGKDGTTPAGKTTFSGQLKK